VAFGFRLGRPVRSDRPAPAAQSPSTQLVVEPASRAQRLAFDLQRDQAAAAARLHPLHLTATAAAAGGATAATPGARPDFAERPARLGDAYRRPQAAPRRVGGRA
jgi:hypothetical protein